MSETLDEFLAAVDVSGGSVPSDDLLRTLSGLGRSDASELTGAWDSWPIDAVRGTAARLAELVADESGVQVDELFAASLSHADDEVRCISVTALTGNNNINLVAVFSSMLESDPSDEVRSRSATALGGYAEMADAGRMTSRKLESLRETLEDATEDPSVQVAGAALIALAGMPGDPPTDVIESWYDRGVDDDGVLAFAYAAMGRSGDERWTSEVLEALEHPSVLVRESATLAYGELRAPYEDIGCLAPMLEDDEVEVQMAAVAALRMIGTGDAREMLSRAADELQDSQVTEAIETAMRELQGDDDMHQVVTPEMMEVGLYGGGGTSAMEEKNREIERDVGRYDLPTQEGWGHDFDDDDDDGEGVPDENEGDEDIGEDLEDWYESEDFWRDMQE